jgi:uncharacterized protein (TIGR00251 family)
MIPIETSSAGATFKIKVQPRARKNAIIGFLGDALKIAVTAPPVGGKANQAVIEFFADYFKIPRSSVTITSGETGRLKGVRVTGITAEQVRRALTPEETR